MTGTGWQCGNTPQSTICQKASSYKGEVLTLSADSSCKQQAWRRDWIDTEGIVCIIFSAVSLQAAALSHF
jgi:hypothetical protein